MTSVELDTRLYIQLKTHNDSNQLWFKLGNLMIISYVTLPSVIDQVFTLCGFGQVFYERWGQHCEFNTVFNIR